MANCEWVSVVAPSSGSATSLGTRTHRGRCRAWLAVPCNEHAGLRRRV